MTDASHVKNGRLGPFQLDRRYRLKDKDRDDLLGTDLGTDDPSLSACA